MSTASRLASSSGSVLLAAKLLPPWYALDVEGCRCPLIGRLEGWECSCKIPPIWRTEKSREGAFVVPLPWLSPWQALKKGLLNFLTASELCLDENLGMCFSIEQCS